MKIKILILVFAISLFSINTVIAQTGEELDNEDGTSMLPVIFDLDTLVKIIEEEQSAEIVRMEFDILKTKKYSIRTLYQGWNYIIFVYGDYRIKQIDLKIYKKVDRKWQYISTGEIMANTSTILEKPKSTAEYKFEIIANEFNEGYSAGHYAIIIYH